MLASPKSILRLLKCPLFYNATRNCTLVAESKNYANIYEK
jgi:hypothetical protein